MTVIKRIRFFTRLTCVDNLSNFVYRNIIVFVLGFECYFLCPLSSFVVVTENTDFRRTILVYSIKSNVSGLKIQDTSKSFFFLFSALPKRVS